MNLKVFIFVIFLTKIDAQIGGGKFHIQSEIATNDSLPLPIILQIPLATATRKIEDGRKFVNQIWDSRHSRHSKYAELWAKNSYIGSKVQKAVEESFYAMESLETRQKHLFTSASPSMNITYNDGYLGKPLNGHRKSQAFQFAEKLRQMEEEPKIFEADESRLNEIDFNQFKNQYAPWEPVETTTGTLLTVVRDNIVSKEHIVQGLHRGELSHYLTWMFDMGDVLNETSNMAILQKQKIMVFNTQSLLKSEFNYRVQGSQLQILLFIKTIDSPFYGLYTFQDAVPIFSPSSILYQAQNVEYAAKLLASHPNETITITEKYLMESCSLSSGIYVCQKMAKPVKSCATSLFTMNVQESRRLCNFKQIPLINKIEKLQDNSYVILSTNKTYGLMNCTNKTLEEIEVPRGVLTQDVELGCSFTVFNKTVKGTAKGFLHIRHEVSPKFYQELAVELDTKLKMAINSEKMDSEAPSILIDAFGNIHGIIGYITSFILFAILIGLCIGLRYCKCCKSKKGEEETTTEGSISSDSPRIFCTPICCQSEAPNLDNIEDQHAPSCPVPIESHEQVYAYTQYQEPSNPYFKTVAEVHESNSHRMEPLPSIAIQPRLVPAMPYRATHVQSAYRDLYNELQNVNNFENAHFENAQIYQQPRAFSSSHSQKRKDSADGHLNNLYAGVSKVNKDNPKQKLTILSQDNIYENHTGSGQANLNLGTILPQEDPIAGFDQLPPGCIIIEEDLYINGEFQKK